MSSQHTIVFVTGASAGFGEAIARRFAAAGARVVASARRSGRIAALAEELGPNVLPVMLDVQDRAAVAEAVAALPGEFAEIDVLVNNAGLARGMDLAHEADLDDWDQMVDTNCKGLTYCTRAILPGMVTRGRGHIINLGSTAGSYPYPRGNVYAASKAFVRQFSLALRADVHGTGVRVTCVEPGLASGTEFFVERFGRDRDRADALYAGARALDAGDVAEAVYWTASLPPHVNINVIEMMPTVQGFGPLPLAGTVDNH